MLFPAILAAQSGGSYSFPILYQVNNARTAALGGYNVSLAGDLALFGQNPALLDSVSNGDAVANYNPFFADINAFTVQYAADMSKLGPLAFGLTYVNYGSFGQTDATGAPSGTFTANDLVFTVGKAHRQGPFVLGANLKWVHSGISGYTADAIALDLGGLYQPAGSDVTIGISIQNLGGVLNDYTGANLQLPVRVLTGLSVKPEGMPIRFSFTGHHLTDEQSEFYDTDDNPNFADEIFKRVSIGAEVLFSKKVNFLIGYDHNRKRELRLEETSGGSGFSYGFKIQIKKYTFRFSRATYHAAGGTSFISLQTNLKEAKKIF